MNKNKEFEAELKKCVAITNKIFNKPRDPKRIHKVLKEIEKIWIKHPDSRLGQMLDNASSMNHVDVFYVEDDVLVKYLKKLYK